MFTASECTIQDHVREYKTTCGCRAEGSHPPAGDIEVIYLWEEGDGNQLVHLFKQPGMKVLRELLADERFQVAQIDVGP
jgi:hypothetical protein